MHNLIYNDKINVNFVKRCKNVGRVKIYLIRSGIYIGKIFLNVIYFFIKLLPIQEKITMLSRQSDKTNIDFELIEKEIKKRTNNVKIQILCKVIKKDAKSRFFYCFYILFLRCRFYYLFLYSYYFLFKVNYLDDFFQSIRKLLELLFFLLKFF